MSPVEHDIWPKLDLFWPTLTQVRFILTYFEHSQKYFEFSLTIYKPTKTSLYKAFVLIFF